MENKVMGWCVLVLGLLGFAASALATSNDISCGRALTFVLPCQGFLTGKGPSTPSVGCCRGVQKVLNEATNTPIRRSICECFKKAAANLGVKADRSKNLGQLCNVNLPVPIDPNVDCSTAPS